MYRLTNFHINLVCSKSCKQFLLKKLFIPEICFLIFQTAWLLHRLYIYCVSWTAIKGKSKMIFKWRWLLNTSPFTAKMNGWGHNMLTFRARRLLNKSGHWHRFDRIFQSASYILNQIYWTWYKMKIKILSVNKNIIKYWSTESLHHNAYHSYLKHRRSNVLLEMLDYHRFCNPCPLPLKRNWNKKKQTWMKLISLVHEITSKFANTVYTNLF